MNFVFYSTIRYGGRPIVVRIVARSLPKFRRDSLAIVVLPLSSRHRSPRVAIEIFQDKQTTPVKIFKSNTADKMANLAGTQNQTGRHIMNTTKRTQTKHRANTDTPPKNPKTPSYCACSCLKTSFCNSTRKTALGMRKAEEKCYFCMDCLASQRLAGTVFLNISVAYCIRTNFQIFGDV